MYTIYLILSILLQKTFANELIDNINTIVSTETESPIYNSLTNSTDNAFLTNISDPTGDSLITSIAETENDTIINIEDVTVSTDLQFMDIDENDEMVDSYLNITETGDDYIPSNKLDWDNEDTENYTGDEDSSWGYTMTGIVSPNSVIETNTTEIEIPSLMEDQLVSISVDNLATIDEYDISTIGYREKLYYTINLETTEEELEKPATNYEPILPRGTLNGKFEISTIYHQELPNFDNSSISNDHQYSIATGNTEIEPHVKGVEPQFNTLKYFKTTQNSLETQIIDKDQSTTFIEGRKSLSREENTHVTIAKYISTVEDFWKAGHHTKPKDDRPKSTKVPNNLLPTIEIEDITDFSMSSSKLSTRSSTEANVGNKTTSGTRKKFGLVNENTAVPSTESTIDATTTTAKSTTPIVIKEVDIADIAYYLRAHKFNEYDRRYETNPKTAPRRYYMEFPRPPLRSLHWEVRKFCEPSFPECVDYLKKRLRYTALKRVDDSSVILYEQGWIIPNNTEQIRQVDEECKKLRDIDNRVADPFEGPLERFQWRTTASYYMCWYTMKQTPELEHISERCDNFANCLNWNVGPYNLDRRADDKDPFSCALYSFCPDPCCSNKYLFPPDDCWNSPGNLCFENNPVGARECVVDRSINTDFRDIILNRWNVTCRCPKAGLEWNSLYGMCIDVDECTTGTHNCDQKLEACVNLEGTFRCACKWGHIWDGKRKTCTPSAALGLIKLGRRKDARDGKNETLSLLKRIANFFRGSNKSSMLRPNNVGFVFNALCVLACFY